MNKKEWRIVCPNCKTDKFMDKGTCLKCKWTFFFMRTANLLREKYF